MRCEECRTASDNYPTHRIFNPLCKYCGGRYIRMIGQQPMTEQGITAWRRKVLSDWIKYGHEESELRRLARLPLAHSVEPPLTRGSSR